jgi:hypothetical protein
MFRLEEMRSAFWKASLLSLTGYAAAILIGLWIGLWFTLGAVAVLQTVWALFCGVRLLQSVHSGGHRSGAPVWERETFGFALGGLISSCALLLLLVAASQLVGMRPGRSGRSRGHVRKQAFVIIDASNHASSRLGPGGRLYGRGGSPHS